MDGMMWLEAIRLMLILWGGGAVLGVLVGCWARTPTFAFLCGAAVAAIGARLVAAFVLWGEPRGFALVLNCLPPAMVAGFASAAFRVRFNKHRMRSAVKAPFLLSPEAEQAARSHFNPKGQETDAIRQEGDGVEANGED